MRKLFLFFIFSFVLIFSCDDGDVITFELDFEEDFLACEGVNNLVLYKIKEDPSESISLFISSYNKENLIAVDDDGIFTDTINDVTLLYRTYSDLSFSDDLFCNDIPPKVNTNVDEESTCSVIINTVLTEDDNDGVPFNLELDEDTDGDDLPNAIDSDDDGDNILTKY